MGEGIHFAVQVGDVVLFFDGVAERAAFVAHDHGGNVLNVFTIPDGVHASAFAMELAVPYAAEPVPGNEETGEPGQPSWRPRLPA